MTLLKPSEQLLESVGVHRLEQVEVDPDLCRKAPVLFLPAAGDGDE
jgi:hypothetical protein